MIDTHTHLYFPEYGSDIENLVAKSLDSGVSHFILPNVDEESIPQINDFHDKYPDITSMAIGLHPTEVKYDWQMVVDRIENVLGTGKYKAVGEIGMDLYWDKEFIELQKQAFERQLTLADKHHLPVIIHSRDALEETMEIIEKVKPSVTLIFHSFTGKKEDVARIRKSCDPYFGINGVVTYKNAPDLREAIPLIGLDRVMLETDAPFLTPVPHRGKRNDSSYLCYIRDKIAEILNIASEEVEKVTDKNAIDIFQL